MALAEKKIVLKETVFEMDEITIVVPKPKVFVYKVETDKKKIKVNAFGADTDMGSLDLPYNPDFWKNLSMPTDTKFFKQIKSELEGNFGVPLEVQYNLANQ